MVPSLLRTLRIWASEVKRSCFSFPRRPDSALCLRSVLEEVSCPHLATLDIRVCPGMRGFIFPLLVVPGFCFLAEKKTMGKGRGLSVSREPPMGS